MQQSNEVYAAMNLYHVNDCTSRHESKDTETSKGKHFRQISLEMNEKD